MRAIPRLLSGLVGAALAVSVGLPAAPASASGDDYPYRTQASTSATDPWGFTERQCVSFVAWRLKQHSHPISNAAQHWGSAYHWDTTATNLHKTITHTPKIGAIAQWNAYEKSAYYPSTGGVGTIEAGAYGHVAYVSKVYSDGSVQVEQYNMSGNRAYSIIRVKAPRYIYVY